MLLELLKQGPDVNSSTAVKCILAVALLLSVAWKVAIPTYHQNDADDNVIEFLKRNHFNVLITELSGAPVIEAKRGSCSLQVFRLEPDGSNGNLIRHLLTDADQLFVVFRGRVYAQQPIFLTVISSFWSKVLRGAGLIRHIPPVIAVGASWSCDTERLPWVQLGHLTGGAATRWALRFPPLRRLSAA